MNTKEQKAGAGRPKNPRMAFLRERASAIGVSISTLQHWEHAGVDLADDANIRAHLATLSRLPRGLKAPFLPLMAESDPLTAAKLRKLLAEAAFAEIKTKNLEGKLIPLDQATEAMTAISAALRAAIARQKADLPPLLEGLTAAAMASRIEDYGQRLVGQIRTMLEQKRDEWQAVDE